jgi:hypothetical protein
VRVKLNSSLRLSFAQEESLRTLGYHPHEMVTQALSSYLPAAGEWLQVTTHLLQATNVPCLAQNGPGWHSSQRKKSSA